MSQKSNLTAPRSKYPWGITLALGLSLNVAAEPVNLIFAGDIMLDDGPGRVVARGEDPLAPFSGLLQDADYRIGNLETSIATTGQAFANKIYTFRAAPAVLHAGPKLIMSHL